MRAGDVIGGYSLSRRIGAGGMGAVYLARHLLLGRPAAVKVLLPQYSHDEALVERFFREARASSSISHPGIIQIFDFGFHADNTAYIVMEVLEGEPLEARLSRLGALAPESALRITRLVAGALQAAHDEGIVHRDLKPENIFLVPDPDLPGGERAKVLDFGIAKLAAPGEVSKTKTGAVMGTPVYMSPEQCQGASNVDHRSDVYSLGCVLFHMVCGQPPFFYPGLGELFAAHLAEPPPRVSAQGGPPELDDIVERMLAKSRKDRPQSMAQIVDTLGRLEAPGAPSRALASIRSGKPPSTTLGQAAGVSQRRIRSGKRRPRWQVVATTVAVFAAAGVAVGVIARDGGATAEHALARPEIPADAGATPTAEIANPPPDARAPSAPDAAPAHVTIRIASEPSGAVVRRARRGNAIGATPFEEKVELRREERTYWLLKRRHRPERVVFSGGEGGERTVRLTRRRRRRPPDRDEHGSPDSNAPKDGEKGGTESPAEEEKTLDPGAYR